MTDRTTMQITPYFADGEKYPNLIGVRAEGDEHETAYVKKSDMAEAVDYWRRMYEGDVGTRYSNLFGTPEKAARTLIVVREECEDIGTCYPNCPFDDAPACPSSVEPRDYDVFLEWLRGDAE